MKKSKSAAQSELFFSFTWDFLNEYMPKQIGRSPNTIESYGDSLSLFRRYLNEKKNVSISKFKFSDCTRDCIFGFREYLEQSGSKPSTVNVRVTALRAYLNYAADKDVSIQSVALAISKIPPRKMIQKEKDVLTEEMLAAILIAPPQTRMGMRNRTILIILYDSAMRLDELLSIRLCDMSLNGKEPGILLHGKGKKERCVVLTEKTVGHLKQYLQVYHADSPQDAYLFSTTIKGKTDKMSPGNVQMMIKQYAEVARMTCKDMPESVYPHMLRRTRATDLYQDGVALELISAILGHAFLETTKGYAKPSLKQLRESIESVPTPASDEEPLWIGNEDEMARLCGLR